MRVWNVKRTWERPFFVHCREHNCPLCGGKLRKEKASRVVNSKSEEAKDFDFAICDTHAIGNVRFIWTEFRCDACQRSFRVNELYRHEKVRNK